MIFSETLRHYECLYSIEYLLPFVTKKTNNDETQIIFIPLYINGTTIKENYNQFLQSRYIEYKHIFLRALSN